jgi:hypothetical protein
MRASSYRSKFLEVLCDVCDLAANQTWPGEYRWTADYFSRSSRWYRFRGQGCASAGVTEGRMLDTDTGHVRCLSPSLLTFVMLEFDSNELIAAYTGPSLPTVCIAQDLITTAEASPEVLALSIERIDDTDPRIVKKIMTSILFVGFVRPRDANAAIDNLATTPELLSRHWFHDRHFFLPREQKVREWTPLA